jgi:1-acyl-sn-glycerol-3-phosphate acyltransferase
MRHEQPAIPAARNRLAYDAIYWTLAHPALWNSFDRIRVQIIGRLPHPDDGPLICYFNHPAWWDLYMGMVIDRHVLRSRFATYGMVEEPQLRAYPFFRLCGGFSVNRHHPREAARSVAYASHLLREKPGRAFYIFPQGAITPNDRRPLELYTGAAHIVRRVGGAVLCPVALRYEFRGEQRPEALIRFGPLHNAAPPLDVDELTDEMTRRLTASADALRAAIIAADTRDFRVLLRGRPGINRVFDQMTRWWRRLRP